MSNLRNNLPNLITCARIAGTVFLVTLEPFSKLFYLVYTFCGVTDVLDGAVARKLKVVSQLGSKLDSIADLLFYTVMMIMVLPYLWACLPRWIWYFIGAIIAVRIIGYVTVAAKYNRFAAVHTYGNKATGLAVFAIPYFIVVDKIALGCSVATCVIAMVASLEELCLHITATEYNSDKKTILSKSK